MQGSSRQIFYEIVATLGNSIKSGRSSCSIMWLLGSIVRDINLLPCTIRVALSRHHVSRAREVVVRVKGLTTSETSRYFVIGRAAQTVPSHTTRTALFRNLRIRFISRSLPHVLIREVDEYKTSQESCKPRYDSTTWNRRCDFENLRSHLISHPINSL